MNTELTIDSISVPTEVSTKAKVGFGIAVAAYFAACYAGGYAIGKLINRRQEHVFEPKLDLITFSEL